MPKGLMRLPRRILRLLRPLPGIGNTQSSGDHQNLRQHLLLPGLQQHPAQRWIQRQPRQLMPHGRHPMLIRQGPQLMQQFVP